MALTASSRTQMYWNQPDPGRQHRSAVSLHSHTQYSREPLAFLPKYLERIPGLKTALGKSADFDRTFWTPPLTARQAYRLEEKQIRRRFQLPGLISLTDHDSIEAGLVLHVLERFRSAPVSTEWTIPFGATFFHVGVHNLPPAQAPAIMTKLARYTAAPSASDLNDALQLLNSYRDVLVVLNHPLWDETGIGPEAHKRTLTKLLNQHAGRLHALEVNGLRSWKENSAVLNIGAAYNLPVVAGGDRHGREPNAVLNLSRATEFPEFVAEVRFEKMSHVVFMPQYRAPLALRVTRMVLDALREYPEAVHARRTWRERVYYQPSADAEPIPMSNLLAGQNMPWLFQAVDLALRCAHASSVRTAMRLAFPDLERI